MKKKPRKLKPNMRRNPLRDDVGDDEEAVPLVAMYFLDKGPNGRVFFISNAPDAMDMLLHKGINFDDMKGHSVAFIAEDAKQKGFTIAQVIAPPGTELRGTDSITPPHGWKRRGIMIPHGGTQEKIHDDLKTQWSQIGVNLDNLVLMSAQDYSFVTWDWNAAKGSALKTFQNAWKYPARTGTVAIPYSLLIPIWLVVATADKAPSASSITSLHTVYSGTYELAGVLYGLWVRQNPSDNAQTFRKMYEAQLEFEVLDIWPSYAFVTDTQSPLHPFYQQIILSQRSADPAKATLDFLIAVSQAIHANEVAEADFSSAGFADLFAALHAFGEWGSFDDDVSE